MDNNTDLQQQIELKKLEIEKLKLESEINKNKSPEQKKYANHLAWNLIFFIAICIVFYTISWIKLDTNINTQFGGNHSYFFNGITGFDIGKDTFSYPLTLLNVGLLISIINNNLRLVGMLAVLGLCVAILAVYNTLEIESLGATFATSVGTVSSSYQPNFFCFIPALSYFILFVSNAFQKSSNQLPQTGEIVSKEE